MSIDLNQLKKKWQPGPKPEPVQKKKPGRKPGVKKPKASKPKQGPSKEPKQETILSSPPDKKKRRLPDIPPDDGGDDDDDISKLADRATRAKLEQEIHKAELGHYKSQKEKIEFMKKAGDLQETNFAEFLYYGYMEKCNLDIIGMTKKLRPKLEAAIKDCDILAVIRLIDEEHKAILLEIKKSQANDIKEWRKDL